MALVLHQSQKHRTHRITSGMATYYIIINSACFEVSLQCRKQGDIVGAIDWHSFSQLILRPYGIMAGICMYNTVTTY